MLFDSWDQAARSRHFREKRPADKQRRTLRVRTKRSVQPENDKRYFVCSKLEESAPQLAASGPLAKES
jgi:hypothetical protein